MKDCTDAGPGPFVFCLLLFLTLLFTAVKCAL